MKSQIISIILLLIGSVLFILDDINIVTMDYRITVMIMWVGVVIGLFHLLTVRDK